jgi:hypothetical protein
MLKMDKKKSIIKDKDSCHRTLDVMDSSFHTQTSSPSCLNSSPEVSPSKLYDPSNAVSLDYFSQNLYNPEELCVDNLLPSFIPNQESQCFPHEITTNWSQNVTSYVDPLLLQKETTIPFTKSYVNQSVTFFNPCYSAC